MEAKQDSFRRAVEAQAARYMLFGIGLGLDKIFRSPAYQGLYETAVRKKSLTRLTTRGNA